MTSPNTGSFHGKNAGTFRRKLSSFCRLVLKLQPELPNLQPELPNLQPELPNLQLKKYRYRQLVFVAPLSPPPFPAVDCVQHYKLPRKRRKDCNTWRAHTVRGRLSFELGGDVKTGSASKIGIGSCTLLKHSRNEVNHVVE